MYGTCESFTVLWKMISSGKSFGSKKCGLAVDIRGSVFFKVCCKESFDFMVISVLS